MLAVVVALSVLCFFLLGGLVGAAREVNRLEAALDRERQYSASVGYALMGAVYPRVFVQSTALPPSYFVDESAAEFDPVGTLEDDAARPEDHPLYGLHKMTGAA